MERKAQNTKCCIQHVLRSSFSGVYESGKKTCAIYSNGSERKEIKSNKATYTHTYGVKSEKNKREIQHIHSCSVSSAFSSSFLLFLSLLFLLVLLLIVLSPLFLLLIVLLLLLLLLILRLLHQITLPSLSRVQHNGIIHFHQPTICVYVRRSVLQEQHCVVFLFIPKICKVYLFKTFAHMK